MILIQPNKLSMKEKRTINGKKKCTYIYTPIYVYRWSDPPREIDETGSRHNNDTIHNIQAIMICTLYR